jgi:hypothetical protein
MTLCPTCPIYQSCQHKLTNPVSCIRRPAPIGVNVSTAFANLGRKRIMIVGRDYDLGRVARDEHRIRMGLCEGVE